ncbi:MAG: zinc ABC transporter substrate-binding protein [Alphaproteobacteria bacterium]|nr:zinc ABC transporter substrate-binding protein [Alphaproteobacteria bacterium]
MAQRFLLPAFATLALAMQPLPARALDVVTTVKPIHSLVAAVMAGAGTPSLLIGGAASPHTYQLKPSEAKRLEAADLVIWVGPTLETPLAKPLRTLVRRGALMTLTATPGIRVLAAREGGAWEDLHDHGHKHSAAAEELDGHLWLDPENAGAVARAAAAALAQRDPPNAERYRANAAALSDRLAVLDGEMRARLVAVKGVPFLSFHDAYQYLEARYGLNGIGAIAVSPERKPGAKRLQALRQRVRTAGARCVFSEPQFDPGLVATVIEGSKARTAVLDPLGATIADGPDLYPALMRGIADALRGCLAATS